MVRKRGRGGRRGWSRAGRRASRPEPADEVEEGAQEEEHRGDRDVDPHVGALDTFDMGEECRHPETAQDNGEAALGTG